MSTEVGSLQASLSLDISNFAQGMQQAVSLVQQFGQQLRTALGNTQGFSALQRQAAELKAEIESIVSAVTNLKAAMGNSNNAVAMFTSIKQHSSGLSGDFDRINSSLTEIVSLLNQMRGSFQNTAKNAKQTNRELKQTESSTRKASNEGTKLSNTLQKSAGFAANLKHIIGGIVISQSFYRLLNIMTDLVAGSYEFMNNMAQTEIAFKYLLGNERDAKGMLEGLQDLSISSPISTSDATEMSRKLMAMGFSAKSVIPTLKILTDTSAVFTNSAGEMNNMMQHVVLALGQMKASGKVSMQELRQLYNAGIPIFQLLQDGLGLTAKEVRNIGKLGIDSGIAIVAILDQLQKKYTGAAAEMSRTIPGAFEVIKDSIFVINNMLFASPFAWLTEQLNAVADRLGAIVKIARVYGVGGVFQAMFPREWHMALRNVIGTFQQFGLALASIGKSVGIVFRDAMSIIINIAGVVGPPIATLVHALAQLANWLIVNVPLVRYLLASLMAYMMVTSVVKVLVALAKALHLVTIAQAAAQAVRNLMGALKGLWAFSKVGTVLLLVAGAFLAVAMASERAKAAIASFFGKVHNASKNFSESLNIGFDPNEIAMPEFKEPETPDFSGITDGLGDIADGYEDAGDAADKAKKKNQSYLQSFDEVYQIKPAEDSGGSGLDGLGDSLEDILGSMDDLNAALDDFDWTGDFWTDWGNLSAGLGDGFDPDALDLGELGMSFWEDFVKAFEAPEWVGAGLGGIIGALLGSLVGHPLIGAAIGSLLGWLAGLFWDDFKEAFNLSDYAPVAATIAAAIAFVLGKVAGLGTVATAAATLGALLGSMIVSTVLSKIAEAAGLGEYSSDAIAVGQSLGTLIGGAIGLAFGHPMIGAAIGNLAGGVVGLIWGALKEKLGVHDWQGIADLVGAGIGAALTGLASGFWEVTIEPLVTSLTTTLSSGVSGAATSAGAGLVFSLKNALEGGILGAIAGLAGGLLTNALTGWIAKEMNLGEADLKNSSVGQSIGSVIGGIAGLIISGGNPIGAAIGTMIGSLVGGLSGLLWNTVIPVIVDWGKGVIEAFVAPFNELGQKLTEMWTNVVNLFKTATDGSQSTFLEIGINILKGIVLGIVTAIASIAEAIAAVFEAIIKGFLAIFGIHSPARETEPIGNNILLGILQGILKAIPIVLAGINPFGVQLIKAFANIFNKIDSDTIRKIKETLVKFKTALKAGFDQAATTISNWATRALKSITDFCTGLVKKISNAVKNAVQWFKNLGKEEKNVSTGSKDYRSSKSITKSVMPTGIIPTTNVLSRATPMSGLAGATTAGDGGVSGLLGRSADTSMLDVVGDAIPSVGSAGDATSFASSLGKEIVANLAPFVANFNRVPTEEKQPIYVGTLIADDKGLKELERKLKLIRAKEDKNGR